MPFVMVSGVGRGMGVLDAVLGGEFGASHCNQWGLCDALFSNYFEDLLPAKIANLLGMSFASVIELLLEALNAEFLLLQRLLQL